MKARFTAALFAHAEAVLGQLLTFEHPADAIVSRYFREHRNLGHADRAFVAETVFAVLRRGRSLEARCGGDLSDRDRQRLVEVTADPENGFPDASLQSLVLEERCARIGQVEPQVGDQFTQQHLAGPPDGS